MDRFPSEKHHNFGGFWTTILIEECPFLFPIEHNDISWNTIPIDF